MNRTIPVKRGKQITPEMRKEMAVRYQALERMTDIAADYGVTRQGVFKALRKEGINTAKGQRIERNCNTCGKLVFRTRQLARDYNHSYCSSECYHIWLETLGETYKPSGYNSRMARQIILKYFPDYDPTIGHRVHHINKDCSDNRKINLMVFDSQGNHVRFHRGIQVTPLWSGASI